ncbi:MAG: dihydropteroate synthase [Myxococcota bacterium]
MLGVVNVTPDSFSDGGRWSEPGPAIAHALALLDEGADAVDIGGESTRPGAAPVPEAEELRRVLPVIEGIARARPGALISIDTSKAAVARAAVEAGARWINDVTALSDPGIAEIAAATGATLVLMHARGTPLTMQRDTRYTDLVGEVCAMLADRAARAQAAGVPADRIVVDPGLGFGKAPLDNPSLVASVPELRALGYPVLIGASRKSFVGRLSGVERPEDRVFGSIGAALAAAEAGADWLRVHDVAATRQALLVFAACRKPRA